MAITDQQKITIFNIVRQFRSTLMFTESDVLLKEFLYKKMIETQDAGQFIGLLTMVLDLKANLDHHLINKFIQKMYSLKCFDSLIECCQFAIQQLIADTETYNETIFAISEMNKVDVSLALKLFNHACSLQFADSNTYNRMLRVISRSSQPNLELAKNIFWQAINQHMFDEITYNTLLGIIAKTPEPDLSFAFFLLNHAKQNIRISSLIYIKVFVVLMKSRDLVKLEYLKQFVGNALWAGDSSAFFYNTALSMTLRIMSRCRAEKQSAFDYAVDLFKQAKAQKHIDEITYHLFFQIVLKIEKEDFRYEASQLFNIFSITPMSRKDFAVALFCEISLNMKKERVLEDLDAIFIVSGTPQNSVRSTVLYAIDRYRNNAMPQSQQGLFSSSRSVDQRKESSTLTYSPCYNS